VTEPAGLTVDAFLGGRVYAAQLAGAHRSGMEAVLLSAAIPADFAGAVVDLGSGSGVAGMCVAARASGTTVSLVDRDPAALEAARQSLALPENTGFASRVGVISADVMAPEASRVAAGLGRAFADAVITNPPFRDPTAGTASPSEAKRDAHVTGEAGVEPWVRASVSMLKPGGLLAVIYRADGLADLQRSLAGRFGDVTILPIHPRADKPALRVLVVARKGSRAPEQLLPGFVLHEASGHGYVDAAERILRHGAGLADVHPAWAVAIR
jgi:tRNA1(Val) A37 N6-methylase TrmN6